MIRGILRSSHDRESNPIAQRLHSSSVNHSGTPLFAAVLSPHRTSQNRKHVDPHYLLQGNQSTQGRTHDTASIRHGFPRKSHMFDDVIRPAHHVHSLTTVGVMTGVIVFLTIGAAAVLALICCKRNFRLTVKDDEQPEDIEDCQLDELDVIFDNDDVVPLFLSCDSSHVTRKRLELHHTAAYEPEVTFNGAVQRQGFRSSVGGQPHPNGTTWNRSYCPNRLEVVTSGPINDLYENSDPAVVTFGPLSLTSEKLKDNDVVWRASSEAAGYSALADGCRDGYRRIEMEEKGEEEDDDDEEDDDAGAMETSLEDNNSADAAFESAETD